jgi:hypothetical protein
MGMRRLLAYVTRRPREAPADTALVKSRQLVEDAIRRGRQMVAFHGKQWLVFSPFAVRERPEGPHVLAYLLCWRAYLEPQADVPSRRWVWLPLAELWGLDARGDDAEAAEQKPTHQLEPAPCDL